MINHLILYKINPGVEEEKIEWMIRETRILLLKIPEVLSLRCGKSLDEKLAWPFFVSVEIENTDKLSLYLENPNHAKFLEDVLRPNSAAHLNLDYEMELGKDVLYA